MNTLSKTSITNENTKVKNIEVKKKKIIPKVANDDPNYIAILHLLNIILTNIGRESITEITQFVNIDREDINKISLETIKDDTIFLFFIKNRTNTKSVILNTLRNMIKNIGYDFSYIQKEVYEEINGKKYRKTHTFYSIK